MGVDSHAAVPKADACAYPGAVVVVGVHAAVADGAVMRTQPLPRAAPLTEPPRERLLIPGQHPAYTIILTLTVQHLTAQTLVATIKALPAYSLVAVHSLLITTIDFSHSGGLPRSACLM